MLIKKILNNNAVISRNDAGEEIVVMGKGLAYGKKSGDIVDESKIIKVFELGLQPNQKRMVNLIKDIPIEYMDIADKVIKKAKCDLNVELDDTLYISLIDHIHTSIERYKEGIVLSNHLLIEIKSFYKKEYELGKWTLDLIKEKYDVKMNDDEAGFIALHIVSNQIGKSISDTYEITSFIHEIIHVVEDYFSISLDKDSLPYYRFVTHLKFFGKRIFTRTQYANNDSLNNDLLDLMKSKYVQPYMCALKIEGYVQKKYKYNLNDEEVLFLTIHVAKIMLNK